MNMCIVMNMNIYIKEQNEELLRRYDGSMSGLVNRLLEDFFSNNPASATGVRREVDKAFDKTPITEKVKGSVLSEEELKEKKRAEFPNTITLPKKEEQEWTVAEEAEDGETLEPDPMYNPYDF